MNEIGVVEESSRWRYADMPLGIPESHPLDFHSPYGCSKGSGDQYVRDYARIYDLPTVVLRQSCIYGPRQFGIEDQGWVAWMIIAAVTGRPLTIYGDGKQIRDVLNVHDLLDAYDAAVVNIKTTRGSVYNLGGGPTNTLAIWMEFGPLLEKLMGRSLTVLHSNWRPGDQRVFVADIRNAEREMGRKPRINFEAGVTALYDWVSNWNSSLISGRDDCLSIFHFQYKSGIFCQVSSLPSGEQ
jgi:CDP-paratose 2-epimerase